MNGKECTSCRLRLDFSIEKETDRIKFVDDYLNSNMFQTSPPTAQELELMANYILWGKDENGLNAFKRCNIDEESRHKTWDNRKIYSWEELIENPTFCEITQEQMDRNKLCNVPQKKLNRQDLLGRARAQGHEEIEEAFKQLFRLIDETEIRLNYWELRQGKRSVPPRETLRNKFREEELTAAQNDIEEWDQWTYLRNKRWLVELRRNQYLLKDALGEQERAIQPTFWEGRPTPLMGSEIPIFPLGLREKDGHEKSVDGVMTGGRLSDWIFRPMGELIPENFEQDQLRQISQFYWEQDEEYIHCGDCKEKGRDYDWFDFRDRQSIYELLNIEKDLRELDEEEITQECKWLLNTLDYYKRETDLNEMYLDIIEMKQKKIHNPEIAKFVNEKYGKKYTPNYISTIYCQKICAHIAATAQYHWKVVGSLFFEEEFKRCNTCGVVKLLSADNFVKKIQSKDGFTNRCKCCDRIERQRIKKVVSK